MMDKKLVNGQKYIKIIISNFQNLKLIEKVRYFMLVIMIMELEMENGRLGGELKKCNI